MFTTTSPNVSFFFVVFGYFSLGFAIYFKLVIGILFYVRIFSNLEFFLMDLALAVFVHMLRYFWNHFFSLISFLIYKRKL